MNILRVLGIAIVSIVMVVASLLFLCFSECAVVGQGGRGIWVVADLIDLGVIIGGIYTIKKLYELNAK
jgi:hypothetical protein